MHGLSCAKWSHGQRRPAKSLRRRSTSPHDPAFMLYTSGSGGTPKAAVHRHADMLVTRQELSHAVLESAS